MRIDHGCPFCNALPEEFCTTASGKMCADHKQRQFTESTTAISDRSRGLSESLRRNERANEAAEEFSRLVNGGAV